MRVPIPYQADVNYISHNLETTFEVVDNLVNEWYNYSSRYTFKNIGSKPISYGNWSIFFHNIRLVQPNDFPYPEGFHLSDCKMKVYHVGGSLYRFYPDKTFSLGPSKSTSCLVYPKYWSSARTDTMPNWYVGAEGMGAKTITSTSGNDLSFVKPFVRQGQVQRYPTDTYGFYLSRTRYTYNSDVNDTGRVGKPVIPTPVEVMVDEDRALVIDRDTWVVVNSTEFPLTIKYSTGWFRCAALTAKV